jgi:exodeoxyribonuclease V alpha subunit
MSALEDPREEPLALDPFAADLALRAPEPLAELNRGEVLLAADVHVAATLGRVAGVGDPEVLRCVALTVAAAREGHAFVELEPGDAELLQAAGAALVSGGSNRDETRPLRLSGTRLYLDRYWREEQRLAASLLARNRMRAEVGDLGVLGAQIAALFPEAEFAEQRTAAAVALLRDLTVIAGGPGTGKTTTVARIVELTQTLAERRAAPPLVALCAPTGKAAARMQEAVGGSVRASTIHRLLGWLPGGRFRHDATNRLPHDLVIVDETSMVPLSLMVRLVDAVRDDAQLVLVGDPDQLAAIEVGAVLRDIVGPAAEAPQFGPGMRAALERMTGTQPPGVAQQRSFGDGVAVLRRGHRSVASIGALAEAIRRGDADATVAALTVSDASITWLRDPLGDASALREQAVAAYAPMIAAARAGDAAEALRALASFRLLCAHRHGPYGVAVWTDTVEDWLQDEVPGFEPGAQPYPGLPLLVTRNDYELRLHNGDTGVVVGGGDDGGGRGDELRAVFDAGGDPIELAPSRLADVEPLFATTVHKSQGSEFDVAALVLPEADSPLLSRELLYTAVTRARDALIVAGGEEALRAAVARPAGRASGLRELLWAPTPA